MTAIAALAALALAACRGGSTKPVAAPTERGTAQPTATATPPPLTAAQQQFVNAFINAANAKDAAAMRKLILPESLACYDKDTEPRMDRWVAKRLRYTIPPDHTVKFVAHSGRLRSSRFVSAPARPTDSMEIDFKDPQGHQTRMADFAVQRGDSYFLFVPCLTQRGLKRFKLDQAQREASVRKARAVYAGLKDPLRAQLVTLVKEGKTHDAFSLCMHELKLDRRTAADVVDLIAGHEPM